MEISLRELHSFVTLSFRILSVYNLSLPCPFFGFWPVRADRRDGLREVLIQLLDDINHFLRRPRRFTRVRGASATPIPVRSFRCGRGWLKAVVAYVFWARFVLQSVSRDASDTLIAAIELAFSPYSRNTSSRTQGLLYPKTYIRLY